MLKFSLWLARFVAKEPCSIQREILNRIDNKRASWDQSSQDLLFLYQHLDKIIKKRRGFATIRPSEFFTLLKYPNSSINFIKQVKVPINDLEKFKQIIFE